MVIVAKTGIRVPERLMAELTFGGILATFPDCIGQSPQSIRAIVVITPASADIQLHTLPRDFNLYPVEAGLRKVIRNIGQQVLAMDISGNLAEMRLKSL